MTKREVEKAEGDKMPVSSRSPRKQVRYYRVMTKRKVEWFDEVLMEAFRKRKKVTLFECKDEEGGIGIRIDGKEVARNIAWESFEYEMEEVKKVKR